MLAGQVPEQVRARLVSLGARSQTFDQPEERALEWAQAAAPVDALVCATGGLPAVDGAWVAISALASGALIPAGAGVIVLLAPSPESVPHAEAVRAALDNLARTLSVEWARYGITITVLAPGRETGEDDLATLVAFLCSEAGAYYSGCRFELDSLA